MSIVISLMTTLHCDHRMNLLYDGVITLMVIHWETFAFCRKSTKTTKLFSCLTFAAYGIKLHNYYICKLNNPVATCILYIIYASIY